MVLIRYSQASEGDRVVGSRRKKERRFNRHLQGMPEEATRAATKEGPLTAEVQQS